MPQKTKVISYGLGPIGILIAKLALERKDQLEIIGAVDINPDLLGKDLGELTGAGSCTGIKVSESGKEALSQADVVLHATSSFLGTARDQIEQLCKAGVDVVSTTEELVFPWQSHPDAAKAIDEAAKRHGVSILGVGVNPGFVLDALVITLSGVCSKINLISGTRILDASKRRIPFQKKIGIGLSVEQFEEKVASGTFGHVGLRESIELVGSAIGCNVDRIEEKISPKIAQFAVNTGEIGVVDSGKVIGLMQDAQGYCAGTKAISLHIEMYAQAEAPRDTIEIFGEPNISLTIPGGTPGDIATAALVVNSIQRVLDSSPGLKTVKDLRPASGQFG
jgi:hypothetical protein